MELAASGKATIRLTDEQRADLAKQLGVSGADMSELPETVDIAKYDVGDAEEEVTGFSFFSQSSPQLNFSIANIRPAVVDFKSIYIPV